jgi:G:T-mismatch repair DNA endonuclease (very short patch repair protein)
MQAVATRDKSGETTDIPSIMLERTRNVAKEHECFWNGHVAFFCCYAVDIEVRIMFCFKNVRKGSLLDATIHAEWISRIVLTL